MRLLLALAALAALPAHAYCIVNELPTRAIVVEQDEHPDSLRNERRFRHTVAPGKRQCCEFHNLDCNPGGRENAVVALSIAIPGEPAYECRVPENAREPSIKVTGAGTLRVTPNSRVSAYPYVVRIRTHDRKDLTGPRGVACLPAKPKGNP